MRIEILKNVFGKVNEEAKQQEDETIKKLEKIDEIRESMHQTMTKNRLSYDGSKIDLHNLHQPYTARNRCKTPRICEINETYESNGLKNQKDETIPQVSETQVNELFFHKTDSFTDEFTINSHKNKRKDIQKQTKRPPLIRPQSARLMKMNTELNQPSIGTNDFTVSYASSVDSFKIRPQSARAGRSRLQFLSLPKNRSNRYDLFRTDHIDLKDVVIPKSIESLAQCAKYLRENDPSYPNYQPKEQYSDETASNKVVSSISSFSPISKLRIQKVNKLRRESTASRPITTISAIKNTGTSIEQDNSCDSESQNMQNFVASEINDFESNLKKFVKV